MRSTSRRSAIGRGAVVAAVLVVLAGCGGSTEPGAGGEEPSDSHTMADGTVMDGAEHVHDDSHSHQGDETATGPSEAARMICTGQVVDDVARIMGLDEPVEPSSSWSSPMFTCTFELEQGPLVLTVHDATEPDAGMAHFEAQRTSATDVAAIKGVYSLGLPAYETEAGLVSFIREGKTLEVDATGLKGTKLGVEEDMTKAGIAYAVASSVLACWVDHS